MNKLILILVAAVAVDIAPLPAQDTPDLFRQAAEQGHADAQFNLGNMYANGEGVPEDDAEAARWYRMAAEASGEASSRTVDLDLDATFVLNHHLEVLAVGLYQHGVRFSASVRSGFQIERISRVRRTLAALRLILRSSS